MDHQFLVQLRRVGMAEAISTLVLFFVAVPLKYLAAFPLAVRIVGPIHGILFVVLSVMCVMGIERVPLGRRLGYCGIMAALVPFGPFVYDRWLRGLAQSGD